MTDLTLRPGAATESGLVSLGRLLKEAFSATPLGMVIEAFSDKR